MERLGANILQRSSEWLPISTYLGDHGRGGGDVITWGVANALRAVERVELVRDG